MYNAYGFLEVRGLVAGMVVADAMLKAAHIRLIAQVTTNPGLITLVVEGDIGACRAALDAGQLACVPLGEVVSAKVIGRPEPDLAVFFASPRPTDLLATIAECLADFPQGKRADQIAGILGLPEHETLQQLELAVAQGLLKKNQSRYLRA
jgi:ethanolamine utilization protein EutK